jgi:hypothetical protein
MPVPKMKTAALLLMLVLPTAAFAVPVAPTATTGAIPPVTVERNAAAGYAVGHAGLVDALVQTCSTLGEPVAADIAAAGARWDERNAASVAAGYAWSEHTIATQAAADRSHTVDQLREGIRAMLTQQVKFSLEEIFPTGQADRAICQQWVGRLQTPVADVAHDTVHGAAIAELRAIAWPKP